jgi:hypothetical protein
MLCKARPSKGAEDGAERNGEDDGDECGEWTFFVCT